MLLRLVKCHSVSSDISCIVEKEYMGKGILGCKGVVLKECELARVEPRGIALTKFSVI